MRIVMKPQYVRNGQRGSPDRCPWALACRAALKPPRTSLVEAYPGVIVVRHEDGSQDQYRLPPLPSRCQKCHKKLRKSVDTLLARRRAAGKCVTCGADPSPGFKSCAKCRAYQRKRQKEYYYVKRVCRDEIAERRQRRETETETQDA